MSRNLQKVMTVKQKNSNDDQTGDESSVQFGEFLLSPTERLLTKDGKVVPLAPKSLDALLMFVHEPGKLVRKQELMEALWPSIFVAEANLTNLIMKLRKALGPGVIMTVSGHGYRFVPSVIKEARTKNVWQERFGRARELVTLRSQESLNMARELLWLCLAEQPDSAPAWAWFGRCNWILTKSSTQQAIAVDLARAALHRALVLDPDLAVGHQFTATIDADNGQAIKALKRLWARTARNPREAESFAGMVQACRYCGLLSESIEAHRRAVATNPLIITSLPHTLFAAGDYAGTLDTYGGRAGYYLDAACWAALGVEVRARALLSERLNSLPLAGPIRILMLSLHDMLEGRTDNALRYAQEAESFPEPEAMFYFARHCSFMRAVDDATRLLHQASELGFQCAPETLQNDPWLAAVRKHPHFAGLFSLSKRNVRAFREAMQSM